MIRNSINFFILLNFICASVWGQSNYRITYGELKQYEGTYAYTGNSTLQLVVSPKDTTLYAVIDGARYPLQPFKKDIFLNSGKQEISFIMDSSGPRGYRVNDATPETFYKLLSKKIDASDKMWFARAKSASPYRWQYHVPASDDGIPTGSIVDSGLDTALIHTMIDRIINETYKNVHSILIVKNGKLVLEEYFYEYDVNTLHQLRSATKSFSSAMVGLAIDQQLIKSKNDKILPYFTNYSIENSDDRKNAITIEDLLTQRSGFACNDYDQESPGNEVKVYPTHDWLKFMLDLPMVDSPGHDTRYCSGNIILLNGIVERSSGMKLHKFAAKNLFDKLGVAKFEWDFVPDETHQNSYSQLSLRPRDMAKFGMLYLNKGKWKNEQIISAEWVNQSITKHSSLIGIDYGYLWWCENLNVNGKVIEGAAAKGNGGQRIFIWPKQNMVAVITAGNFNTPSSSNRMLIECVLAGLKE